jgi:hypothetical protein
MTRVRVGRRSTPPCEHRIVFRQRLETVERTKDLIELREPPQYASGLLFTVLAILLIVAAVRMHGDVGAELICYAWSAWFLLLGLGGLVQSTFLIERYSGLLRVKRKLVFLSITRDYAASEILTVFEPQSTKGNTLKLRLRSGKTKRLTLFAWYGPLDPGALNYYLALARQSRN